MAELHMKSWAFVSDFDGTISKKTFIGSLLSNIFSKEMSFIKNGKQER